MTVSIRQAVVLASVLWMGQVYGVMQDITAQFRPDPGNPMFNESVNTTPQSGICPGHIPSYCKARGSTYSGTATVVWDSEV